MKWVLKILLWFVILVMGAAGLLAAIDATHSRTCFDRPPPGTEITIPGEVIVVLEPAVEASGDTLVLDVVRDPFGIDNYTLPAEHGHIHPNQAERFKVVSGRARFLIGDEYIELGPGEEGIVPPNTIHHWMALDDEPVRVTASFEPSLDVDIWFANFQPHIAADSMNLLQAAVIAREFPESSPQPVDPPAAVWNALARVLAPVGRMMGYEACRH